MISIQNVNKWYGDFQVLSDCSTQVNKGEVVVVCGPSGSGKSTLIKCVNALEAFQQGDVVVDGTSIADPKTDLPTLRSRVGMVFQHFELFPHLSIVENLTIAQIKVLGRSQAEATEKGLKLLDRVGLLAHAHKHPGQLSGGQQQAVAVARALLYDPPVLIMDEPTSSLDPASESRLLRRLEVLVRNRTVILITHKATMLNLVDKLLLIDRGRILAAGGKDDILRRLQTGEFGGTNAGQGQDK